MDDRFKKVLSDPKFRTLKKKDRKLKIDNRFKSMFEDDKFKLKYARDKRGKANKRHMSEDYKRFYRLSDEEDSAKEETEDVKEEVEVEEKPVGKKNVKKNNKKVSFKEVNDDEDDVEEDEEVIDDEEGDEEEEEEPTKLSKAPRGLSHNAGYHRGMRGDDDDDDSSSSSSDSEEEEEEEDLSHEWNELDRDAKRGEDISRRIAICNADWDRFNAQDIFVLLNSFKPSTGVVQTVNVYYSKFGEERLKVEETKGPSEFIYGKGECIVPKDEDEDDLDDDDDDDEDEEKDNEAKEQENMEKLRKYQLDRLKYFFALVVCDSAETADAIYKELDGMEYESSATTLDIRFVPDEMDFEDMKLKEECSTLPSTNYKPPEFINTALQQSQVKLTWDETDQRRKQVFEKAFDKDIEDDLKAYLASSSDEEELNEDDNNNDDDEEDDEEGKEDKIAKYKRLLSSLDNDDEEVDMQVSWDPTLKDKVFGKKDNEEEEDKKTKDKKSTKKVEIDEFVDNHSSEFEDDSDQDSGSEGDEEEEEDEEPEEESKPANKNGKTKFDRNKWKKDRKKKANQEVDEEEASKLELLMLDVDNNNKKKHFNYKEIVDKYSKNQAVDEDDFRFNAEDPRFSAIYDSHHFNVDQSDPNFKRTDAFKQIIDNKKKRGATEYKPKTQAAAKAEPAWKSLAKKVKLNMEEKQSQQKHSKPNKFRVDSKFKR